MLRWATKHRFGILMVVWVATLIAWKIDNARAWLDAHWRPTRQRRMLVYEVDHAVIRDECRRLLSEARGRRVHASTQSATSTASQPFSAVVDAPRAMAVLKPSGVVVFEEIGEVRIAFGGGFHSWYLVYYDDEDFGGGTVALGDGLWFEDEYGEVPSGP